jgi:uncharacterized radical SAM superfamily Fe-S cluster-containing enzyme
MIRPRVIANASALLKTTASRCPVCLEVIPADVWDRDGRVVMTKTCTAHGDFEVTLARDARYYHLARGRRSEASCCRPSCGCNEDEAARDPFEVLSTCVALIEIVDSCNLACPTCYAASPQGTGDQVDCISFDSFVERVGGVTERKGFIDILQLSGGEPTIHPEFFRILEWAIGHEKIGYVLINTNLVRFAGDARFRDRLAALRGQHRKFELYAQFDGPQAGGQIALRGTDLRDMRRRSLDLADELDLPTTLVMVVTPATIGHIGDAFRFGLGHRCCRGLSLQPMFTSGRVPRVESSLPIAAPTPISVGDVITSLVEQAPDLVCSDDFTPLPCGDPNCHTIGYVLRTEDGPVGLSRLIDLESAQGFLRDRLNYDLDDLARCGCETDPLGTLLEGIQLGPEQPFRIFIKPFMDAWTFDDDRIDRCCTHVIRPDGTLDSFCRYYLQGGACGGG